MWLTRQKLTHISLWKQLRTKPSQGQSIHTEAMHIGQSEREANAHSYMAYKQTSAISFVAPWE